MRRKGIDLVLSTKADSAPLGLLLVSIFVHLLIVVYLLGTLLLTCHRLQYIDYSTCANHSEHSMALLQVLMVVFCGFLFG